MSSTFENNPTEQAAGKTTSSHLILVYAHKITRTYKIALNEFTKRIEDKMSRNSELKKTMNAADLRKIEKNTAFKNMVKEVKKEIYYDLRKYRKNSSGDSTTEIISRLDEALEKNDLEKVTGLFDEAVREHVSTNERLEHIQHFHTQFEDLIKEIKIILDIGGGLYPLTFPFENAFKLEKYIWIDTDTKSYEILERFQKVYKKNLHLPKNSNQIINQSGIPEIKLYNESFEQREWKEYSNKEPDLVLMLKIIPVIWRQQRNLIGKLANVPGKTILVTANKESMTKKENVAKKENTILMKFIELIGRNITRKIDTQNEFGYLLS